MPHMISRWGRVTLRRRSRTSSAQSASGRLHPAQGWSLAPFTLSATQWRACRSIRSPGRLDGMAQGALPGFRDFYPQELAERAYIMSVWRTVASRYAFVEYDGPPL